MISSLSVVSISGLGRMLFMSRYVCVNVRARAGTLISNFSLKRKKCASITNEYDDSNPVVIDRSYTKRIL